MRVLFLTGEYPPMPGGIAGYTELLVGALREHGDECLVASGSQANSDFGFDAWTWKLAIQIRALVAAHDIEVVHIQYQAGAFNMHPATNLLPRMLSRTPVVTTFHDLRPPYLFPKAGRLRGAAIMRMARWSNAVVVTNPQDSRTLTSAQIEHDLVPLGSSLPVPHDVCPSSETVGYFGYPSRQKGFGDLVQALGMIPETRRPTLLIVGDMPPVHGSHGFMSQTEVETTALTHGVSIGWTGHLEPQDASDELAACGAIAFPFPRGATLRSSAMIAALQSGRPVVTTSPLQPGDLLELQGLPKLRLVEPGDVAGISRTIESCLAEQSGQVELPERFQWPEIARRHREIYARATGKLST